MKEELNEFARQLYVMKCGESLHHDNVYYLRVPGGWLFSMRVCNDDGTTLAYTSPAFVPFDNEFMENSHKSSY